MTRKRAMIGNAVEVEQRRSIKNEERKTRLMPGIHSLDTIKVHCHASRIGS